MTRYSKPFLSISDQVAKLKSHGMTISDVSRAERYLSHLGYYRLSAYWYNCRERVHDRETGVVTRGDEFLPETRFSDVIDLYVFDKRLRLHLLDAVERVEVSIRTSMALQLGSVDPHAYLRPESFSTRFTSPSRRSAVSDFQAWQNRLDRQMARSKEIFVDHFKGKYPDSDMPIWIAVELWDFGMMSKLLSGMTTFHKRPVSEVYGITRPNVLPAWVRSINGVRNICAHHGRLWNRINMYMVPSPNDDLDPLLHLSLPDLDRRRTYAVIAVLQYLIKTINPDSSWGSRTKELIATFPATDHFQLADAGFPDDWDSYSLWA